MSEKDLKKIVGENLRVQMQKKNITQIELAEMMNTRQSTISSWALGIKLPRTDSIDALCKIFECKRADLLEDKDAPKSFMPTVDEYELIQLFKEMSEDGQAEVLKYTRLIAASPLYKKHNPIQEKEA